MKHLIYLSAVIALAVSFTGCKKETTPMVALNEKVDVTISKPETSSSSFRNGAYGSVTGTARVYETNGKYQLALENFTSSNGPDLKVYISKEQQPVNFVNLGSLKSTAGNQLYDIPVSINVKEYTYALIYCQQYSHLFGYTQFTY
ncbi:DM13 domain-containing protein [Mucilaginibacter terrae]|uniref:DM13 domain-containing protein n=1 Tax=Mucilaginibacter terrae TaxID=1955052 RepID=UPI003634B5A9